MDRCIYDFRKSPYIVMHRVGARRCQYIAANPLTSQAERNERIRGRFLAGDVRVRPSIADVIDATIGAAAPNQAIAPHGIAQARPDFDGLNPRENGRVPKNGTESGLR
jgi:hypothetical protein